MTFKIGIISDTRGLLRPEAQRRLTGVDYIVHAGDIGRAEIVGDCAREGQHTLPALKSSWTRVKADEGRKPAYHAISLELHPEAGGFFGGVLHEVRRRRCRRCWAHRVSNHGPHEVAKREPLFCVTLSRRSEIWLDLHPHLAR
jgi:hypothetical protein